MTKYTATAPDGTVMTRTSARVYTHVIACKVAEKPTYGHLQWCGSKTLADKALRSLQGRPCFIDPVIVPVN
jgi:hypothetical protein